MGKIIKKLKMLSACHRQENISLLELAVPVAKEIIQVSDNIIIK
jgi:hypothetical protein